MCNEKYSELMSVLNYGFDNDAKLIIYWSNGLTVCCRSITGEYETDTDPEDDDYIGEYAAAVSDVEILRQGTDNSVEIYNNCIEISLKCVPEMVCNEFGKVLWKRNDLKQI